MRKNILVVPMVLMSVLLSCGSKDKSHSAIEVQMIDTSVIMDITSHYDSIRVDVLAGDDVERVVYYYLLKDSIENKIMYDRDGHIICIIKLKNNKRVYKGEYYCNGQIKGTVFTKKSNPDEVIYMKHYYEDGRISDEGNVKEFKHIGDWKHYNTDGKLNLIEHYDSSGKLLNSSTR